MQTNCYKKGPVVAQRPELKPELTPYVPFYQENVLYTTVLKTFLLPYEFSGWKDEQLSWKKTCYLHGGLNPSPTFRFSGPEAAKFLSKYCVNTFIKFPVGSGKHCITCNEDGTISSDGVILRTEENTYETYWMWSLGIAAQAEAGNYNMEFTDLTEKKFLFQVGGPASLTVVEAASGDNLHDVKFMRIKYTKIAGKEVRVVRLGMAGSLAYEIHGNLEDAKQIYDTIYQAGKEFGIRRLGWHAYMMQHTENGFPQFGYHFMMKLPGAPSNKGNVAGSIGPDADGYVNPIELGWGSCVKFDHDFIGREALEKIADDPKRTAVSLEWNKDDILDIYASRFEDEEPYEDIDKVNDMTYAGIGTVLHQDKVLNEKGKEIGFSAGRVYTYYYHRMISIAVLDMDYAEEGKEVIIVWGSPESRQKLIRAKVTRLPYFNEHRNQNFDVTTVQSK